MTFFHARSAYLVRAAVVLFLGGLFLGGCDDERGVETPTAPTSHVSVTVFDNNNIFEVFNNPTAPTVFSISSTYQITLITNYHWNNGQGQPAGTISLTSADGVGYGPFAVTTRSGQGGVPNAYWDSTLQYCDIPPGTYTIGDSNPATWSQNSQSNGRGISTVKGYQK